MAGVVHFEIPADDQERAKNFYSQAFGWRIDPVPELDYNMVITTPTDEATGLPATPGAINGGMMTRSGEVTGPVITVDVPDIDATLKTVEELGGSVVMPRNAIPDMGFYAYFRDTEGNVMGLWESLPAGTSAGTEAAANDIGA